MNTLHYKALSDISKSVNSIRGWLILFLFALFMSGVTVFPAEQELLFLTRVFKQDSAVGAWIYKVYLAYHEVNLKHNFLLYGYDWLAFAHITLAILFIGPIIDPIKNKWVIEFGMIACFLIIPFAVIAGHLRNIPFWWRLIDCSFGIVGIIPLSICLKKVTQIEKQNK